jgi:hypothetical protein
MTRLKSLTIGSRISIYNFPNKISIYFHPEFISARSCTVPDVIERINEASLVNGPFWGHRVQAIYFLQGKS